jgi:hypothetical protein
MCTVERPTQKLGCLGFMCMMHAMGLGASPRLNAKRRHHCAQAGVAVIDRRDGSAYFGFGNDKGIYADFTRFGF